jgi:hypothetical protein
MLIELFNRMYTNENRVIFKEEIEQLKSKYLTNNVHNEKEKTQRKSLFSVTKKFLKLFGII